MTPPQEPKPPRPRQPSAGDLPRADVDKPVGVAAEEQRRFDRPPPKRSQTLPGIPRLATPPLLPLEHRPTAPAAALSASTLRAPTPATGTRIPVGQTPASGQPAGSLPPPSQDPAHAQVEALRRRAEAAEARTAQLERDARAAADTHLQTYPPKVEPQRHPSPVPSSAPTKVDAAIGKAVRTLAERLAARHGWMPLLVALGVGGGATAVLKPSADPAKADATLVKLDELRREVSLLRVQLNSALDREAASSAYTECLAEQQAEYFAQLSPALDRMGAAAPLRPFVDRCKSRKP